ncbi:antibiotic biosynthesis monooxygenase family protein [Marinobacter apostichopi]|uniref:antibiotic biosynthesis monooxygenase family protein n=1 Tax=Marinobacter apostichopi TaxID=3035454 RepID=UPI002572725F|nr:antibiotic biosynthesis monooxygenase [Marinobacter sp. LA51]
MIRVIYRWRVSSENFEAFKVAWRHTTNQIHEQVPGALGSFMLKASEAEEEILTIAKWESLEAWQAFWGAQNPEQMEGMRKLGTQLSVQAYDEIEDFTR